MRATREGNNSYPFTIFIYLNGGEFRYFQIRSKKNVVSYIIRLGHQTGLIMSAPGPPSFVVVCPARIHITAARAAHPVPSTIITGRGYNHARAPTLDGPLQPPTRTVHLKFTTGPDTDCKNVRNLTDCAAMGTLSK